MASKIIIGSPEAIANRMREMGYTSYTLTSIARALDCRISDIPTALVEGTIEDPRTQDFLSHYVHPEAMAAAANILAANALKEAAQELAAAARLVHSMILEKNHADI